MLSGTFFYTISIILIVTSILSILSSKITVSAFLIIFFMLTGALLFFGLGSFECGIFQTAATLLTAALFIILFKKLQNLKRLENIFKTKRFWAGIFVVLVSLSLAWLFGYYYINLNAEDNLSLFDKKAVILPSLSFLVTAKSIFVDYFLSYFYMIIIFVITTGAVSLLVNVKTKEDNND